MIEFDSLTGYLPSGVHEMNAERFSECFGWNDWRRFLIGGISKACAELASAGCRRLIVDGSFVTAKEAPSDWDGTYDPKRVQFGRLDPILMKYDDGRRAMNAKYLGDIFPWNAATGEGGVYLDFFQTDRNGSAKGIVLINLGASS